MRFSFIARFLLLTILTVTVVVGLRFRVAPPKIHIPKTPKISLLPHNNANRYNWDSSGGVHTYPVSTGISGNVHQNVVPYNGKSSSGGAHTYPASTGKSGNTNSGNVRQTHQQQNNVVRNNYNPRSEVHHHYHYSPPQQINYGSTYHPVYRGRPPVYVYEYRASGSRFDNLLSGLALYNLGRNSHFHHYSSERRYKGPQGEVCKLGISKRTGEYVEARIDCNLMSSFIWEDTTTATRNEQHVVTNTKEVIVTQTVNGAGNSSVTTVTSNTIKDALQVKGPSIAVTPDMTCYMIRTYQGITALRKSVDCGLLQEYAQSSLHNSVAQCLIPLKTIVLSFLIVYLLTYEV